MTNDPFIVRPIDDDSANQGWQPIVGTEAIHLLERVPDSSRTNVRESAVAILSKSVAPIAPAGQQTGLVVGYVQSGKTMSFETVAALARDNDFQVIIVVAGTTKPLLDQSTGRLSRDLGLNDPNRHRRWIQFENPSSDATTLQAIRDVLADWRDTSIPAEYKRTVLITVLKHHQRLLSLTNVVQAVGMDGVPVLIIDDEADQASLNTDVSQGSESTTYGRLMNLREALPHHTYLQYTATPQAPLLVSIIDSLSPNFVQVLTPGEEYVGGQVFFGNGQSLVRIIPSEDVPTSANPLNEPPQSLLEALRIFMVGVTIGIRAQHITGNRSMLVHPSHRTAQHQEFHNWVREVFEEWKRLLGLPDSDPDRQELTEELREAHEDLAVTNGDIPSFEELLPRFHYAFRNTSILEVNARGGRTPPVAWHNAYGWILVGGQAMDRGFTIEGLTVTYMPRGIGVGNADTVQQRARFFGYKRRYLGFCRVYLEQATLNAFRSYVEHEEDIRAQLQQVQVGGRQLNDWKRAFILDPALRPCRNNVVEFAYLRGQFADRWFSPRVVLAANSVIDANREAVDSFISTLTFQEDSGHVERSLSQQHQVCEGVLLRSIIEQLLLRVRITGTTDSQRNTGLLIQLSKALDDNPDEACRVYVMSPAERRRRSVDDNGEVTNLFQGANPVSPRELRGTIYPGDAKVGNVDDVSVQIHRLNLIRNDETVAEDVCVVAVWVPRRLGTQWVSQGQPGQE